MANPKSNRLLGLQLGLAALALGALSGCAAAAIGAGAAGAVAYTDRGAKSEVNGSVEDVNKKAQVAFQRLGISTTETHAKEDGKERELVGKAGDKTVTIQMSESG